MLIYCHRSYHYTVYCTAWCDFVSHTLCQAADLRLLCHPELTVQACKPPLERGNGVSYCTVNILQFCTYCCKAWCPFTRHPSRSCRLEVVTAVLLSLLASVPLLQGCRHRQQHSLDTLVALGASLSLNLKNASLELIHITCRHLPA